MANDTPFSFHCMICFEEFTPENRYPVVLPCGHTYVCNICSERLEKCMECRTSLYMMTAPVSGKYNSGQGGVPASASWRAGGRGSTEASPAQQLQAPLVKKKLPLPKNVVLLSLIEATELASQDVRNKNSPRENCDWDENNEPLEPAAIRTIGSMIDVEDEEEEKIKMGTSLAAGVAGTYAVAVREGLEIFPNKPVSMLDQSSTTLADQDVENLVRFFHDGRKRDENAPTPSLSYGDRVQIVSVEDGWAKLARGYGYINAQGQHLVKVGNALDRACKMEAILKSLSNRKKELRMEQSQIDNQFIRMLKGLEASLHKDEDLTVILADTFSTKSNVEEVEVSVKEPPREHPSTEEQNNGLQKPSTLQRQSTPPLLLNTRFGCFGGDVFEAARTFQSPSSPNPTHASFPTIPAAAFLSAILPDHSPANVQRTQANTSSSTSDLHEILPILPAASHPSPSAMRAGAEAWRERSGHRGIDFRTGMSGHTALLSTHAHHPHDFLEPGSSWNNRLRMSSHMGLSSTRAKASPSFLSSFAPSIRGRTEESRDQVSQTESL